MGKYRKRPVEVEAFQFEGPSPEFDAWVQANGGAEGIRPFPTGDGRFGSLKLSVQTEQGQWVECEPGEWVIPDRTPGRFYPVAPEVFDVTYEAVS